MDPLATPKVQARVQVLRKSVGVGFGTSGTSPLRRSLVQSAAAAATFADSPINDDDSERLERRAEVAMRKSLANVSAGTSSPIVEIFRFLNTDDAKKSIHMCFQLFSENKITPKNVWSLKVIDAISQLAHHPQQDLLQIAAMSLDVSAKVYAVRVDDVYNMTLKLASEMSRARGQVGENDVEGEEDCSLDKTKKAQGKKRTRKRGPNSTVDHTKLLCLGPIPQIDTRFFVPFERAMCNSDLFTSQYPLHEFGHCFKILSDAKFLIEPPQDEFDETPKNKIPQNYNMSMRTAFDEIEDEDDEIGLNQDKVVLDDDGIPIPELDGSIHETFQNDFHDPDEEEEINPEAQHRELREVVDILPENFRHQTEYTFTSAEMQRTNNPESIEKLWAGPNHWKVESTVRSAARYTGSVPKQALPQKRNTKKKEPQLLDIRTKFDPALYAEKIANRKPPSTPDISKLVLPIKTRFCEEEEANRLFYYKKKIPTKMWSASIDDEDGNVSGYNYTNPNDSLYCVQQPFQGDDDNGGTDDAPPENIDGGELNGLHAALATDNPTKLALYAKKLNIKKLKEGIWTSISGNEENNETFEKSFSAVHKELPIILSESVMKDISFADTFMAVLHLCNEKQLHLAQKGPTEDFIIEKYVAQVNS